MTTKTFVYSKRPNSKEGASPLIQQSVIVDFLWHVDRVFNLKYSETKSNCICYDNCIVLSFIRLIVENEAMNTILSYYIKVTS